MKTKGVETMNNKEFESLIKQPANIRYEYFIKQVVDREEIWGLYNDGWAASADDEGNYLFPFWPRKEFAEYCAIGDWSNYKAEAINLQEFVELFLLGMVEDGIKPSIFFNNDDSAVLEVEVLKYDLERELENY
ncbi:Protein of unknown function [Paenibacillus sp. PDC88]|nr:Protein of unknown function [Paenibacillus sp. PDC88]